MISVYLFKMACSDYHLRLYAVPSKTFEGYELFMKGEHVTHLRLNSLAYVALALPYGRLTLEHTFKGNE